jgi:hypothetical protein
MPGQAKINLADDGIPHSRDIFNQTIGFATNRKPP